MTTFSPPIEEGVGWAMDPHDPSPPDALMKFYGTVPTGTTIYKDHNGEWVRGQYPYQGGEGHRAFNDGVLISETPNHGLADAEKVFQGGHTYDIDDETKDELIAAGFGDFINTEAIELTWTTEQLAKLENHVMTVDGDSVPAPPFIDGNGGRFLLSAGAQFQAGQRRDFWEHTDTDGWTDTHAIVEALDPPIYAANYGGDPNADFIPQMGIFLRRQFNPGTGKWQAITLNNGTFLGLPILNIGAWHAFEDGSGFQNRQFSWPLFESLPLPYGFEVYLEGNIVTVRQFPKGAHPETTPWTHPTLARVLNLDTDCGSTATVPTPVGTGANGVISAHIGTDSRGGARLRKITMERIA